MSAREKLCDNGSLLINYESRWWKWKIHTCPDCGVKVLPYLVRWTSLETWRWEIRYWVGHKWDLFKWKVLGR